MTGKTLVIDVWEGQLDVDYKVLKDNGVAGVGIRLNDMNGGHHLDTHFKKNWENAKSLVRFPYFVYNPWVTGVANFLWLKENMPDDAKSVAIDIEVIYPGYTPSVYASNVETFLASCKVKWKTIIYTAEWFLPKLSKWPAGDYWWAQYPSRDFYFYAVRTWDELQRRLENPNLQFPVNREKIPGTLKMWQFSGDYLVLPGSNRDIDVNAFYGSVSELKDYFLSYPQEEELPDFEYSLEQKVQKLWEAHPELHKEN